MTHLAKVLRALTVGFGFSSSTAKYHVAKWFCTVSSEWFVLNVSLALITRQFNIRKNNTFLSSMLSLGKLCQALGSTARGIPRSTSYVAFAGLAQTAYAKHMPVQWPSEREHANSAREPIYSKLEIDDNTVVTFGEIFGRCMDDSVERVEFRDRYIVTEPEEREWTLLSGQQSDRMF